MRVSVSFLSKRDILVNLREFCRKNLFESRLSSTEASNSDIRSIQCDGPLGTGLRYNITEEWWKANVISSENVIFGVTPRPNIANSQVDVAKFPAKVYNNKPDGSKAKQLQQWEILTAQDLLMCFLNTLPLLGNKLPFGLAQIQSSLWVEPKITESQKVSQETVMTVHFYVSSKTAVQWFNEWQRRRIVWWKKFSGTPSKFSLSTTVQGDSGDQTTDILFEFPWGQEMVERVTYWNPLPLQTLAEETGQNLQAKDGRKNVTPCVIECVSSTETALVTYLLDAMIEKQRHGAMKTVLRLHHCLATYKVAMTIGTQVSAADMVQLRSLVTFVVKELRQAGVAVLSIPDWMIMSRDQQYSRYDEMGVPYCIVLNEGTLKNGIIGLRSRDTTLKEQVHINEVKSKLLQYLNCY